MSRRIRLFPPSVFTVAASAIVAGSMMSCDAGPPETPSLGTTLRLVAGEIEGVELEGELDSEPGVHVYRGIPYAEPPVNELRWRPPQPVAPWEGVRPAAHFGPICPQPRFEGGFYALPELPQDEDCLTLNVWTAAATAEERRPVMVWIHGGGFTTGTGRAEIYDGAALARDGAVVVTINYRLNAFGFLAHPALSAESEHGSSSHYGILDQIAALTWVRDNIAAFGGDPQRVTIFGESAGSMSVSLLMVSPLARGLFHRAIGQSGGAFFTVEGLRGEGLRGLSAEAVGERFAEALGVADASDVAAAMRAKPHEEIVKAFLSDPIFSILWGFTPVDGWVLPDQPRALFARGEQADVPTLTGSNADEGTALVDLFPKAWWESVESFAASFERSYGESAPSLRELYPVSDDAQVRRVFGEVLADDLFTYPAWAWAQEMTALSSPAYLYRFTHVPPIPDAERYGSFHAAEIPYVFGTVWPEGEWSEADDRLSDVLRAAWVRFAATGDPNGEGLPEWPAFTREEEAHMELGEAPRVGHRLRAEYVRAFDRHYRQGTSEPVTSESVTSEE